MGASISSQQQTILITCGVIVISAAIAIISRRRRKKLSTGHTLDARSSELTSRAQWVFSLEQGLKKLEHAPQDIKGDYEAVLAAVTADPRALKYAAEYLREDPDLQIVAGLRALPEPSIKRLVCVSKKFSLHEKANEFSEAVIRKALREPAFKEYEFYNPDLISKDFCAMNSDGKVLYHDVTNFTYPCRGFLDYPEQYRCQRPVHVNGRPTKGSCWRFSYRFHEEKAKRSGGFLLQIVEMDGLGAGQLIEQEIAEMIGLRILRIMEEDTSILGPSDRSWQKLISEMRKLEADHQSISTSRKAAQIFGDNVGGLLNLKFVWKFNHNINIVALPNSLQSLTFGHDFNQSMQKVILPRCLQDLTFGNDFNQSMENVFLPRSLQSLTFGYWFNQSMEKVALPSGLRNLKFGMCFNQSMEKVSLPSSLETLTFGVSLNIDHSMEKVALPSSLLSLTFHDFNQSIEQIFLPSSLQTLTFGWNFNQSMEHISLPSNLHTLTFGRNFNQSMDKVALPNCLLNLRFGWKFNQSMENIALPSSLQTLTFGSNFNSSMEMVALPSSLQNLTFGWKFNHSMEKVTLPSSLQNLTFGRKFHQNMERVAFPSSLQSLTFGNDFDQIMEKVVLPQVALLTISAPTSAQSLYDFE